MKKTEIIQNLKCGGCANTIVKALNSLNGIKNTNVLIETNSVEFEYESEDQVEAVERKLSDLGYPIDKDPNSLYKKAKSLVSCVIGGMEDDQSKE